MARFADIQKKAKAGQRVDRKDLVDDLNAIRTAFAALLAKLDIDDGVTEEDYADLALAPLKTKL